MGGWNGAVLRGFGFPPVRAAALADSMPFGFGHFTQRGFGFGMQHVTLFDKYGIPFVSAPTKSFVLGRGFHRHRGRHHSRR